MLPPDLAAFSFALDAEGSDAAVAARAAAATTAHGARTIAVVGAQRWGLLAALARSGLDVVAFDPSRAALDIARRALENEGVSERVTLYAGDPRDAEVPGGADAVLVTSAAWRVLLHDEAVRATLRSLRRALVGPSLLLLDLDRVPPLTSGRTDVLRDGPGRQRWSARLDGATVRITCEAPGVATIPLDLAATQPEDAVDEVRAAGFDVVSADDAAGGVLGPTSRRMWLVARAR